MKAIIDLTKWLLERDIRPKNALSLLLAVVAFILAYFTLKDREWFGEIRENGIVAAAVSLLPISLMVFLVVSLVWTGVAARYRHINEMRQRENEAKQRQNAIHNNLMSLSDWQWEFLGRLIHMPQIHAYQVGHYRAIWEPEVEVLVRKRIVKEHRSAEVYELDPEYRDYLQEHFVSE